MSSPRPNYARDINLVPPIVCTNVRIVLISVSLLQTILGRALDTSFDTRRKQILRKLVYNLLFKYELYLYVDQIDLIYLQAAL
jgi:hypothetical protein